MPIEERYSGYDSIAFTYHSGTDSSQVWLTLLEQFILEHLPEQAHFLDLGCGKGELLQKLLSKGYQVTGLDSSNEMLNAARLNAPNAHFILEDVRSFKVPSTFHAVISAYNTLTYILSLEELTTVFHNVYTALLEDGWFAFDISQGKCFQLYRTGIFTEVTDDYAVIQRGSFDPDRNICQSDFVLFQRLNQTWQRSDVMLLQRAYSPIDVQSALEKVGFTAIKVYDATYDLVLDSMEGRKLYICRKSQSG